jgi:hypothetical protein
VTRPGHCKLGMKTCAYQGGERVVLDRHPRCLAYPLAEGLIRGEAFGPVQGLLQAGEHRWGQRDGCARGEVSRHQRLQAPGGIHGQPAADGVAMHAHQAGDVLAGLGLATRQEVEHLQAGLLVAVMVMVQAPLERGARVVDRGYGMAHRAASRQQ